jgi:hypothetical protein
MRFNTRLFLRAHTERPGAGRLNLQGQKFFVFTDAQPIDILRTSAGFGVMASLFILGPARIKTRAGALLPPQFYRRGLRR